MTFTDIKIYSLNSTTLMLSMSNIDDYLKIVLLIISIGYTIQKMITLQNNNNKNKNDKNPSNDRK